MRLLQQKYGKQRVRVLKVIRKGETHDLKEIMVSLLLDGGQEPAYVSDDNSWIVATDTVKNTITALAKEHLGSSIEDYALFLGNHFLKKYAHLTSVHLDIEEKTWQRLTLQGSPHPHSFISQPTHIPTTQLALTRAGHTLISGLKELHVLKSTASSFVGYPRCEFTTLPETTDRILSSKITAEWTYQNPSPDYSAANAHILDALLTVFQEEFSPSVQRTLFQMGQAALHAVPEISQITLKMPNKHYLPVNLKPFALENANEIFLPTDEPHGEIEATVTR
jgi:urate oxidase